MNIVLSIDRLAAAVGNKRIVYAHYNLVFDALKILIIRGISRTPIPRQMRKLKRKVADILGMTGSGNASLLKFAPRAKQMELSSLA
jgi:hypothetical protein